MISARILAERYGQRQIISDVDDNRTGLPVTMLLSPDDKRPSGKSGKMKYIQPDYYEKFTCLAGHCPLSCCRGWNISIDEASLDCYGTLPGRIGREVRNAIDWETECFLTGNDGRCALQTGDGLCALQLTAGEEALCDTCRLYPRHTEEFKGCREYSLNLSCPEAARLILFDHEALPVLQETTDDAEEDIEFDSFDEAVFANLLQLRERIFRKLLSSKDMAVPGTPWMDATGFIPAELIPAEMSPERLRCFFEKERALLENLEVIDPSWPDVRTQMVRSLQDLFGRDNAQQLVSGYQKEWGDTPLRRLYAYFIYVYLAGAVYDDDIPGKLSYSAFCVTWVHLLWLAVRHAGNRPLPEEMMAVLAARLARETEHDDDNFERIAAEAKICACFSCQPVIELESLMGV